MRVLQAYLFEHLGWEADSELDACEELEQRERTLGLAEMMRVRTRIFPRPAPRAAAAASPRIAGSKRRTRVLGTGFRRQQELELELLCVL